MGKKSSLARWLKFVSTVAEQHGSFQLVTTITKFAARVARWF
jgi:hypothetical protein